MHSGGVVVGGDHAEGLTPGVHLPNSLQCHSSGHRSLGAAVDCILRLYGCKAPQLHATRESVIPVMV